MLMCPIQSPVHVNTYLRRRLGRWERVREHCRSTPRR